MVVSLVVIVFLRFRYVNMRKEVMISRLEKEANQSRLNFLKSQMNPHFYFNTLNAINSFVLKHEIREANRFLTTFAKLMREILENSQKEFVKISEEKQVLEKYLSLQKLRFPGQFDYAVEVDPKVSDHLIPPMFLQPFVENSVEYAFQNMKDPGFLKVVFAQSAG
jgi:sensor histidine kinase YesM